MAFEKYKAHCTWKIAATRPSNLGLNPNFTFIDRRLMKYTTNFEETHIQCIRNKISFANKLLMQFRE